MFSFTHSVINLIPIYLVSLTDPPPDEDNFSQDLLAATPYPDWHVIHYTSDKHE
jgi:hypothetical protein